MKKQLQTNVCRRLLVAVAVFFSFSASSVWAGSSEYYNYFVRAITYPSGSGGVYVNSSYPTTDSQKAAIQHYDTYDYKNTYRYDEYIYLFYDESKCYFLGWATSIDAAKNRVFIGRKRYPDNPDYDGDHWYPVPDAATKDGPYDSESSAQSSFPTDPLDVFYGVFTYVQLDNDDTTYGRATISNDLNTRGETITLKATARKGNHFVRWQNVDTNATVSTENPYTFTVSSSYTVKAVFEVGEDTGIDAVTMDEDNTNAAKYDLSGKRVDDSYKGVVLQNGKKYLNK